MFYRPLLFVVAAQLLAVTVHAQNNRGYEQSIKARATIEGGGKTDVSRKVCTCSGMSGKADSIAASVVLTVSALSIAMSETQASKNTRPAAVRMQ